MGSRQLGLQAASICTRNADAPCLPLAQVQHRCRVLGSHERGPEKDWVTGREQSRRRVWSARPSGLSFPRQAWPPLFFSVLFLSFFPIPKKFQYEIKYHHLGSQSDRQKCEGGIGIQWKRRLELGGVWIYGELRVSIL